MQKRELDNEALELFAGKGRELGTSGTQVGEANAFKVRRILQITEDLTSQPISGLRVLDLGCGEGVYAIEVGLYGADVVAVDARTERMDAGVQCALRHGLSNVSFRQADVRDVSADNLGHFDVVYCLGLLYHLDVPDVFKVLEELFRLCGRLLIIDTWVCRSPDLEVVHRGRRYAGIRDREHAESDSAERRRGRLLKSIDNAMSFHFTRDSLFGFLSDVGFSSVFECMSPLEPGKPSERLTIAALKGQPVHVAAYPWINTPPPQQVDSQSSAGRS